MQEPETKLKSKRETKTGETENQIEKTERKRQKCQLSNLLVVKAKPQKRSTVYRSSISLFGYYRLGSKKVIAEVLPEEATEEQEEERDDWIARKQI